MAREALESGEPVVVMDADVLYHPGILRKLLDSDVENCYLLDRGFTPGDEPVKIAVKDGLMVEFRKQLADGLSYDIIGESVGFFRFGPECAKRIAAGKERDDSIAAEDPASPAQPETPQS